MKTYNFYGWQTADIKDERGLTPRDYYDLLEDVWAADTCAPVYRDRWNEDNMTLGQCSITAFTMQDIYGGDVYGVPTESGDTHCFNVVGDCLFDLTSEQFEAGKLDYEKRTKQSKEEIFAKAERKARYELLKERLFEKLK